MMGRGRGRGGRFGGRGGVPGGGGLTALDHLRDTAEEMGLDPRAASGSTQQEPLPSYPYIPIYPPRPLTEDEGIKIQAQRELVHWWQHSVYYLQPAARAATVTKEITRYSDRYRGTLENDGSRGPEAEKDGVKRSRRASLWEVIHVPEPKVRVQGPMGMAVTLFGRVLCEWLMVTQGRFFAEREGL
ncbi:DNA-directed RNA polymerase III, subunit Rpc31 [Nannochloropsis gaditana]|uniref:DNA-directed RNA polymerase III, subunit Rpc31 n=1 Tax=Nannochloropsis gaditana TaxID=72520 RepID=W7TXZ0_9STRA|nr:DNA-directed RNA polymerase III, subunit Rpc31 [Nannochloropsis gaditana]